MQYALQLAERGLGRVEPNPPVGAVIVDAFGRLIGQGWHERFGADHAEIAALKQAGEGARGGTLYVTLEPCSHQGKTPPCVGAVIQSGLSRVRIATGDPAPWVNGRGIAALRAAGLEVEVGLEAAAAQSLIQPFSKLVTRQLPWVHAKWAMTLDGKIASSIGDSRWISSEASREISHRLRGRMDAIIVGSKTALRDDPRLTARPAGPRVPLRVVVDSQARLPLTSQLVRTLDEAPVMVATLASAPRERLKALESAGVEPFFCEAICQEGSQDQTMCSLGSLLTELGRRQMTHVLLEGGGSLLGSAFDADLVDEVHVFIAPRILGGGRAVTPVGGNGLPLVSHTRPLIEQERQWLGDNVYWRARIGHVHDSAVSLTKPGSDHSGGGGNS